MKLNYHYFMYEDCTLLPRDPRAHACWRFYTLAQQQKELIGDGHTESQFALLDDMLWMDKRYEQTARSVAMQYQLESPDEFAKFWEYVRAQARAFKLPEPADEYTRLAPRRFLI